MTEVLRLAAWYWLISVVSIAAFVTIADKRPMRRVDRLLVFLIIAGVFAMPAALVIGLL